MTDKRLRPGFEQIKEYKPGLTIEEIREQRGITRVVKLASNENPLGLSPIVRKKIEQLAAMGFRYPQNGSPALVEALSDRLGIGPERILAGCGSDEIIDLIVRMTAKPGRDHILTHEGCFSMYPLVAKLAGVECRQVARAEDLTVDVEALAKAATEDTAAVFLASPDNPTGTAVTAKRLVELAKGLPERTLLVVDEAYIDFASPRGEYDMVPRLGTLDNVAVLRTFSKAYGLAGFRLGYGVLPGWLAGPARSARIPFTVNLLAEAAGVAALEDEQFLRTTLELTLAGREYLADKLAGMGCTVWPSQSNFIMFRPGMDAGAFCEALLDKGVIVRHLASFGFGDCVRVNMGTDEENDFFLNAAREVLGA